MDSLGDNEHPSLQADERTTLSQFLDYHRRTVAEKLRDLSDGEATTAALPATNLTVAGIVRHLAWIEDRWFHFRLLGNEVPEPWASMDREAPDWSMRLLPGESVATVLDLYAAACARSRAGAHELPSVEAQAPVPSFGDRPVTLRWVLVHLLEETAAHEGHIDLLRDEILRRRSLST